MNEDRKVEGKTDKNKNRDRKVEGKTDKDKNRDMKVEGKTDNDRNRDRKVAGIRTRPGKRIESWRTGTRIATGKGSKQE